jgi:hypothetical protein
MAPKPTVEVFPLNTSGGALGAEVERVCIDNELVITTWSPVHLRAKLMALYWKADKSVCGAIAFWDDTLRYLYLPRLKNRGVLDQTVMKGAGSQDFFGTAYGYHDGKYDGFKLGDSNVQVDDTLLLIDPIAAKSYLDNQPKPTAPGISEPGKPTVPISGLPQTPTTGPTPVAAPVSVRAKAFRGSISVNASTAKMRLVQVAEEVIAVLTADPNADVKVTLEIQGFFPTAQRTKPSAL